MSQLISFEDANPILAVSSANGIYSPFVFAQRFFSPEQAAKYPALMDDANVEDVELYADEWQAYTSNDGKVQFEGAEYCLFEGEDYWLIVPHVYEMIDWDSVA